ncbi:MAG: hypothetical protein R3B09_16530 [Nannocystaceae bacterium]
MNDQTLLQNTIDPKAPSGDGDGAVLLRAMHFFLRQQLGATSMPHTPNIDELRKMLPVLEGYVKALLVCASGDGDIAEPEREWILGFCANAGGTHELIEELRTVDPRSLDVKALITMTERPELFKFALIYHAIQASDADGILADEELAKIRKMAAGLGIDSDYVDELIEFHMEEKSFLARKWNLIFPQGHPWAE